MSGTTSTIILFALTVACTSSSQVFQKLAAVRMVNLPDDSIHVRLSIASPEMLISAFLLLAGLVLWLQVLNMVNVSLAYPLLSINYIVVMLCSRWIFGEKIPSYRWVGLFAILAGVFLLLGSA